MNRLSASRKTPIWPSSGEPGPALAWSGGKDSAMALYVLGGASLLLTTVTETHERVSMHGVRRSLLRAQARAVGVPVLEVPIPPRCTNAVYEARMAEALEHLKARGIRSVAFGDIFLADVRAYRERQLARAGMEARFPLWGRDTGAVAREFLRAGFRAVVVCVDLARLDASWAGREFDEAFLAALPAGVDPCGEKGEFHTCVYDGPVFAQPVAFRRGAVVERDGFAFADLLDEPPVTPAGRGPGITRLRGAGPGGPRRSARLRPYPAT
ncbi:Dph6-related ATP pyrophosphatase [Carboxydichorda subterranea]|uniref:Dph6-related ATP pyrophosphatase n=1 Tax=Carboxydichorda subterranea TaxID=3109565 RepID=UPI0038576591